MKTALLAAASLVWFSGCSGTSNPDGGRGTTGGSTHAGGTTGGSNGSVAACPLGAGCTLSGGGAGVCCSAGCVDTTSDPGNCGGCGNACPSGATCVGGYCTVASCAGAASSLSCTLPDSGVGDCCAGACLDPNASFDSDAQNCGGCGAACATGATCQQGQCTFSDGGPGYCNVDGDCPSGEACTFDGCQAKSCAAGTAGEVCALAAGLSDSSGICCSSACVDAQFDDANCGGCGIACAGGQSCLNGVCMPAMACGPATFGAVCLVASGHVGTCCGGACIDTYSDPVNCSYCGNVCPSGSSCQGGGCVLPDGGGASCSPPSAGCPSGTLCTSNGCSQATCAGSSGFCFLGIESVPGLCCNGSCVDPTQDPANCGGCGVACASGLCAYVGNSGLCLPSGSSCAAVGGCPSGESCVGGQCQQNDCNDFETNLCATNGKPGVCCFDLSTFSAYCADIASDAANCGGCGQACPSGQSCAKGLCSGTVAPCAAGHIYDGCDVGGAEVGLCCPGGGCSDVSADVNNCGYCGNACSSPQTCVAGSCQ